jgi:hypothetical protein
VTGEEEEEEEVGRGGGRGRKRRRRKLIFSARRFISDLSFHFRCSTT